MPSASSSVAGEHSAPPQAIHVAAVSEACEPNPVDHCEVQPHSSPEPSAFLFPHNDSFCEVSPSACVEPISPSCEAFFPDTISQGVPAWCLLAICRPLSGHCCAFWIGVNWVLELRGSGFRSFFTYQCYFRDASRFARA